MLLAMTAAAKAADPADAVKLILAAAVAGLVLIALHLTWPK